MSERQGEREKNDKVSEICARDETYVIFFFVSAVLLVEGEDV